MSKRRTPCKLAAHVGARIRFLRRELGWSLKTLGELAESSATGLHAIETGQTAIRVDTLRRIARALHVEPFELLNHDTEIDDITYIVEKVRQDAAVRAMVMARVGEWESRVI